MTSSDTRIFNVEMQLVNEAFLESIVEALRESPSADLRCKFKDYIVSVERVKPGETEKNPGHETLDSLEAINPLLDTIQKEICTFNVKEDELPAGNINNGNCAAARLTKPRTNHITWHEYFMSVAQLAARRSKDPSTQVGACIVNGQNKIVATGYNGMPNGVNDNLVPWQKEGPFLATKYAYVVHAELNAILNSILTDQTGCRVYVTLFPCNECAKAIIQSGIRHVIYLSDKHRGKDATKAAKRMFEMAGVKFNQYATII